MQKFIVRMQCRLMERDIHADQEIRSILSMRRVVVVGMSRNPAKAAHYVPKYLYENEYEITPVNPNAGEILGRKCHADIDDAVENVGCFDIVDVFRPSVDVPDIVRQAVNTQPKAIWLQEGIRNIEAEEIAKEHGIDMVFNRCMMAEHKRLFK